MKMTFKNGIVVEGTPEELERVARWGLTGQEVQPEQPKYHEVKRPAKVGERVRVVNATITGGKYKNGDEFTVLETKETGGVIVETSSGRVYISYGLGEYVVLEPIEGAEDGKTEEPTEQEASSRLKVGDYARVVQAGHPNFGKPADEAKWAAIGRKVGEKRKGDLVRVTNACGAPVKVGGVYEVEDEYVGEGNSAYIEGGWAVICELVCPVEQRFDKTE